MSTQISPANQNQPATAATPRQLHYTAPAIQLLQDAEGYLLEVELPGVPSKNVELTVADGQLTILAHRPEPSGGPKVVRHWVQERSAGNFKRVFDLDPSIDPASVTAEMHDGLLTIKLRKAAAHQPRRISVTSGS